jgi:hypothetical protein
MSGRMCPLYHCTDDTESQDLVESGRGTGSERHFDITVDTTSANMHCNKLERPLTHPEGAMKEPVLEDEPLMDPHVISALTFWFSDREAVKKNIAEWRHEWNNDYVETERWRKIWKSSMGEEHAATLGKLDLRTLNKLLQQIEYEDVDVRWPLVGGFPVTGVMKLAGHKAVPGGLLRKGKKATGEIPDLDQLRRQCTQRNQKTLGRIKKCVRERCASQSNVAKNCPGDG